MAEPRVRRPWRWPAGLLGPRRCGTCGKPLRRFVTTDLTPGAVRVHRLAGTLGGLLASGFVCEDCTKPGEWVLIE